MSDHHTEENIILSRKSKSVSIGFYFHSSVALNSVIHITSYRSLVDERRSLGGHSICLEAERCDVDVRGCLTSIKR